MGQNAAANETPTYLLLLLLTSGWQQQQKSVTETENKPSVPQGDQMVQHTPDSRQQADTQRHSQTQVKPKSNTGWSRCLTTNHPSKVDEVMQQCFEKLCESTQQHGNSQWRGCHTVAAAATQDGDTQWHVRLSAAAVAPPVVPVVPQQQRPETA